MLFLSSATTSVPSEYFWEGEGLLQPLVLRVNRDGLRTRPCEAPVLVMRRWCCPLWWDCGLSLWKLSAQWMRSFGALRCWSFFFFFFFNHLMPLCWEQSWNQWGVWRNWQGIQGAVGQIWTGSCGQVYNWGKTQTCCWSNVLWFLSIFNMNRWVGVKKKKV